MIRISKTSHNKIVRINVCSEKFVDLNYATRYASSNPQIDSFVIIPGVTQYNHIYTSSRWIFFDSKDNYIAVEFQSEGDVDRFFAQFQRDIKLNQLLNVETKDTK